MRGRGRHHRGGGLGPGRRAVRAGRVDLALPGGDQVPHVEAGTRHRRLLDAGAEGLEVDGGNVGRGHAGALHLLGVVPEEAADPALVDDQLVVVDPDEVRVGVVPAHGEVRPGQHGHHQDDEQQRPEGHQTASPGHALGAPFGPAALASAGSRLLGHRRRHRGHEVVRRRREPLGQGSGLGEVRRHGGHGRRGVVALLAHHHIDHHHGDVVASPVGPGRLDEEVRRLSRVGHRRQHLADLLRGQFVGQSVAAQQEPVTPDGLDPPQVDGDPRGHAEGAGEDVPVGVDGRLGRGQLARPDHLLGQAVVGGDLGQLSFVEAVGTGVTHVDQGQHVLAVLVDQGHRREGGPHAPQLGILLAALPDHGIGLGDRLGQARAGGLAPEGHRQGVDGQPRRHLAAGVAAHAVGHGEEVRRLDGQVLVDRADQTGVGG